MLCNAVRAILECLTTGNREADISCHLSGFRHSTAHQSSPFEKGGLRGISLPGKDCKALKIPPSPPLSKGGKKAVGGKADPATGDRQSMGPPVFDSCGCG